MDEFARWCPSMRVVKYHGPASERRRMEHTVLNQHEFDVVLTTYGQHAH